MKQRVLVTGVSRFLGGRLAQRLEQDPNIEEIIGVDIDEPHVDLTRTEYVRADIRNPLIVKVLQATGVDTVVHTSVIATPGRVGGRTNMKEINVIGTMQLFAACQKAEKLRKVVMKSSTAIYGSEPSDPGVFSEEMSPRSHPRTGYAKDSVEVENYARSFGRRRTDVSLTILRFANFIGPQIDTPLTRYFGLPLVPTALGFDPRLQFLHEDDAIEILYRATVEDHPGTFNAAGDGVLYLSQAIRLGGKVPVPVPLPFINMVAAAVKRSGIVDFSQEQVRLLLYGRVGDVSRLKNVFGYEPQYSTREAFADFVARRKLAKLFTPEQAAQWERELYRFLARRKAGAAWQTRA
ncbi:MAG TPA: NAD-dependent epimerase/dehydratase family protein [Actinomycetota bacterium]|nr:NAD-dependent epimerase/dehydratase family protein [Actinomycetota bacterium]